MLEDDLLLFPGLLLTPPTVTEIHFILQTLSRHIWHILLSIQSPTFKLPHCRSTYGRFFSATTFLCCRMYFADFAITVIFYPVIKSLFYLCILFGCSSTQIWNLRAKINFINMLKNAHLDNFEHFCKIKIALKFDIWVLQRPNNMHKKFHKVFITG